MFDHLFLHCPFVIQVWSKSFWHFNANLSNLSVISWFNMLFDPGNSLFSKTNTRAEFIVFTAILYNNIWFSKNLIAHGSAGPTVQEMVDKVSKQAHDHWKSFAQVCVISSNPQKHWTPPPTDWIKANVDASFVNGKAQTGIILRDCNGSVFEAASYSHDCIDPTAAETLAIFDACKLIASLKIKKAILESDCLVAITMITSDSLNAFWTVSPILEKIFKVWHCWPDWKFNFAPRMANRAAHSLAQWGLFCNIEGSFPLNSLPAYVFCDPGYPLLIAR
ncbi:hypothetical protein CASFOL_042104 [Castilleja foliolosa]|uniref:RNase H type-1 domain-containing protein n=1 Tax=Castilleja foliolosa TaxID=1961234 RepID=A0ABD3B9J2_9LAMI